MGNLNPASGQDQLREAFASKNLDVRKASVLFNDQGQSKGAGFVQFASATEAQKALDACANITLDGSRLFVQMARQ